MRQETYDVIAWGRVVVADKTFFLLAPKPYHSEVNDGGVGHSVWQPEGTLKWEVADCDDYRIDTESKGSNMGISGVRVYERFIIIFGSDALIEFFQDPKAIKVIYVIPDEDDDDNVAVAPTN